MCRAPLLAHVQVDLASVRLNVAHPDTLHLQFAQSQPTARVVPSLKRMLSAFRHSQVDPASVRLDVADPETLPPAVAGREVSLSAAGVAVPAAQVILHSEKICRQMYVQKKQ